jgi:putative glutamine amidotransferase
MAPRIAIPEPTSDEPDYNPRALPQYIAALEAAGAEPVVVPLNETRERIAKLLASAQGVLLPGSGHDVDPARYGEPRAPECASDDPVRAAVDELLLQDSFNLRKPILAICHGTQTLNVWRGGSLIQDLKTPVNHRPGREVVEAHPVQLVRGSRLTEILAHAGESNAQVNSSHHQAIRTAGNNLSSACSGIPSGPVSKANFRARSSLRSLGQQRSGRTKKNPRSCRPPARGKRRRGTLPKVEPPKAIPCKAEPEKRKTDR